MAEDSQSFLGSVDDFIGLQSEMRIVSVLHSSSEGPFRVLVGERMGKKFAVKTLKEELTGDAVYTAMLHKEFEIEFGLSHSGIVRTVSFEEIPGLGSSIVQEFVEGMRLDRMIEKGQLKEKDVDRIVSSLAATLEYIHNRRVVHCDIKPANIIISAFDGLPVLIDFGFADSAGYSGWKFKGGTSRYIAPERFAEGYKNSPGNDIWSLGQIIKDLLPFAGKRRKKLANIAKSCLMPVEKRIERAEDLNYRLNKRLSNFTIGILISLFLIIGAVVVVIVLRSNKPREDIAAPSSKIYTSPVMSRPPVDDTVAPSYFIEKEADEETLSAEPEDTVASENVMPAPSFSPAPEENIETLSQQYEGVEEGLLAYYSLIADNYARNAAYGMIEKRKEAGLYKKPRTLEEALESRAVFDSVMNDIKEYVVFLDIPDEEMRRTVIKDAQQVARDIIREEGNKLPWD